MSNTFADVFDMDENNSKQVNGTTTNPFASPATTDPFGISTTMTLSQSSERFDDQAFPAEKKRERGVRPRSGKDALSSSNWLAYQHSMDEANFDPLEDLSDSSFPISSTKPNSTNPFAQLNELHSQDPMFANSADPSLSFYDLLGFDPISVPSSETTSQPSKSIESTTTTKIVPSVNENPNSTSNNSSQDPTLDWFSQPDSSTKDKDALAMFYRQNHILSTLQETSLEMLPSPPMIVPSPMIRQPSDEDVPSICIHEPTSDHNESNVVPDGYFDQRKNKKPAKNDDDSDEEAKMTFTIKQARTTDSTQAVSMPIPLLPPPPKKGAQETSSHASSSSSDTEGEDDDDPLAMFRTKTSATPNKQGASLITDWPDEEKKSEARSDQVPLPSSASLDYYLHEPDCDDRAPLESYHNDITELQLQQLNGWLLQIRVPLREKSFYKSKFQRFSETRTWQECYVRIFFEEKKLRFYLPQTIEQAFAEIDLQTWYQCTKCNLQQYDQYTKIHTIKIFEANYREIPQVRLDRLVTLPEKLFRKFTRPNKAQQVLLDHANCVEQEIVKFSQLNYTYLKQFSIILDDLFWSMPVTRGRLQKHLKEELTVKILDEYSAHIDRYRHICKQKSRTRIFLLAFLNGTSPTVEIGMNDWFRHGKEVNKRNEIIINKTLQEYWIKPEQVELASILDASEYESTHVLKLIPPDSEKIEMLRFRTRPKQNIELPLQVYCFMSVIDRQVAIRIELTVSNAFNMSLLSKAASLATNDKTASIRDDDSDEHCPCEDIQIRFPIPDPWVYMFRVEKRFRYGAIHSVRRRAGKIKGLDRFMVARNDGLTPFMAASAGVAKYEQAFRSIVWRVDQLPKRDQGAYKTHVFECKMSVASHDPIPEKYQPIADVEYSMSQAFISHCQIRSVAVPSAEETPEKWIRPKCQFTYTIEIEYAFKEEEKKEFAPIEIDMKEQPISQSETEANSQSDQSD